MGFRVEELRVVGVGVLQSRQCRSLLGVSGFRGFRGLEGLGMQGLGGLGIERGLGVEEV